LRNTHGDWKMRILSIQIQRLKSIQVKHDKLTFYNPDTKIPMHTVIVGENGIGKSTFLEALTLPSHITAMTWSTQPPNPNDESLATVEIEMMLSDGTFDEDGNMKPNGTKGTAWFFRDKTEAAFITDHLADKADEVDGLKGWKWYVDTSRKVGQDFKDGLEEQVKFNRPAKMVDEPEDYLEALRLNRDENGRSKLLATHDEKHSSIARGVEDKEIDQSLKRNISQHGNIYYINTDQNTYGAGNHILESAKNIQADLSKIFHFRLPATVRGEFKDPKDKDKEGKPIVWDGQLRGLKGVNEHWQKIFGRPINETDPDEKMQRSVTSVRCSDNGNAKFVMINEVAGKEPVQPKYLSSGENEAFFVLATIISCKLHNCVLLLDEPELHMHLTQQIKYYKCLKAIFKNFNIQAIIITHSHFLADKILSDHPVIPKDKDGNQIYGQITLDEREHNAQIRELKFHEGKILIRNDRIHTITDTLTEANEYILGYYDLPSHDLEARELVNRIRPMLGRLTTDQLRKVVDVVEKL